MSGLREAVMTGEDIYDVQPFMRADDYRSCPCFVIDEPGFRATGHCWRASCDYHPYDSRKSDGRCCVHVTGPEDMGSRLRALLDEADWYGGWALEFEP